ncbi:MAG: glycosyltransferase family 1 protein [Bacteroidota bacterium]
MNPLLSNIEHPVSLIRNPESRILRIGLDAKRAFNNGTGLGNYSRFVINGLLKYFPQHEYFLFTPGIKPEFEQFYTPSTNVNLVTPDSFLGKTFSSLWRTYAIADMCNELKLDVFHGLSNELPVGIESFTGKKIATLHDLIFLRYPNYYGNIDRYIYTRKFKYACEQADIVLAASEQTKQDIVHYFGTPKEKIKAAYQNCDDRFGQPATPEQKQSVTTTYALPELFALCVGTIEQRKNQLTVLKAFHALDHPTMKLVFIGKQTPYTNQLTAYIEQHGLQDKVIFLQGIPLSHLPVIYQLSGMFIYASEFEGFGIPVLEGLRSGVPVIAANASSLPEVGGNSAHYFEPNDVSGLLSCMKTVLTSKTNSANLKEHLQQFDTSILIESLMKVYRS